MPIHTSYKSMIRGMRTTYCKKGQKTKSRPLSDGTKVAACTKAWSVFYATLNKRGWKDTQPRPKTQETVEDFILEHNLELLVWFEETLTTATAPAPRWVLLGRKIINSKKASVALKNYWRKRLAKWKKKKGKC